MKNWMLAVAGLFLAAGVTVSETAKAEFPGMAPSVGVGVNVNVGFRPVPFFPAQIPVANFGGGGFSHGFPGAGMYPPSFFPRPYCGQMINPYAAFGGFVSQCFRPRPRRRHFALAIAFGRFRFAINTGNSYY